MAEWVERKIFGEGGIDGSDYVMNEYWREGGESGSVARSRGR